jgi:hypothetical protein
VKLIRKYEPDEHKNIFDGADQDTVYVKANQFISWYKHKKLQHFQNNNNEENI